MEAKFLQSLSGQTPTFISHRLAAGSALTPLARDFSNEDLPDEAQINQCSSAIPGHSLKATLPQILLPELYSLSPVTAPAGEWKVVKETIIPAGIQRKSSRKKGFFSQPEADIQTSNTPG